MTVDFGNYIQTQVWAFAHSQAKKKTNITLASVQTEMYNSYLYCTSTSWPRAHHTVQIMLLIDARYDAANTNTFSLQLPSVWHCWLGVMKSIRCVKNWVMRCWHGYLSGAMCKRCAHGPANANAATSSLCSFNKFQIGLTFLVPAYAHWSEKEAIK